MTSGSKIFRFSFTVVEVILSLMLVAMLSDSKYDYGDTIIALIIMWAVIFSLLIPWYVVPVVKAHQAKKTHQACMERIKAEKHEALKRILSTGYKTTVSYEGSGRWFSVDEKSKKWLVMDFKNPLETKVYNFMDILGIEKIQEKEMSLSGSGINVGYGLSLNSMDSSTHYTRLGLIVKIKDIHNPTVFINCINSLDEFNKILSTLENIISSTCPKTK